jgi:hypothetical protein
MSMKLVRAETVEKAVEEEEEEEVEVEVEEVTAVDAGIKGNGS